MNAHKGLLALGCVGTVATKMSSLNHSSPYSDPQRIPLFPPNARNPKFARSSLATGSPKFHVFAKTRSRKLQKFAQQGALWTRGSRSEQTILHAVMMFACIGVIVAFGFKCHRGAENSCLPFTSLFLAEVWEPSLTNADQLQSSNTTKRPLCF